MTIEELNKLRIKTPLDIPEHLEWDEHGQYSTGCFMYKGKTILITIDGGKWHLSVSANHPLGYYEIKQMRYMFLPNRVHAAQIFPPREELVNLHENCYHLYEI